ncbi:MAG: hypothetical protein K9K32_02250 [Halanaerobiales bacterium]|nr:hypothetical protein [Halanaerobiales bacterium]
MKVKVNKKTIEIFKGAQVKDVIRKYSLEEYKKIKNNEKLVNDQNGNIIMLNGELSGNEELFIVEK